MLRSEQRAQTDPKKAGADDMEVSESEEAEAAKKSKKKNNNRKKPAARGRSAVSGRGRGRGRGRGGTQSASPVVDLEGSDDARSQSPVPEAQIIMKRPTAKSVAKRPSKAADPKQKKRTRAESGKPEKKNQSAGSKSKDGEQEDDVKWGIEWQFSGSRTTFAGRRPPATDPARARFQSIAHAF